MPGLSLTLSPNTSASGVVSSLQIVILLALLSFAPAILVMMTAFTRVVVVLSFVRSALSTQTTPPNQVIVGLALFLTLFIMTPTFNAVNAQALQPYLSGTIGQSLALTRAELPFKQFMARQTRISDVELFLSYEHQPTPRSLVDLPMTTLIPAFAISELKTAFQIGFMVYIPFLIVDLVVATTLMSMNMMMLPPVLISLPLKILLFVMVNGWYLVVKSILAGFH
ncbi:MAG: flagellar type III secretion system pore protein FliP [Firmicutes bacterium]|nr:flagellar type III secretion system pore protein FliP [Bacillota bacterium]